KGLVKKLALKAAELDIIGANVSQHLYFAPPEPSLVVCFDDRNARIINELDAGDDALAGRHQNDEVVFLSDEVLKVGEFRGDVAAVPIDEVIGEAELLGSILEACIEVRVKWHLQVGNADADLLVGRQRARNWLHPLHGQAAQCLG